MQDRWSQWKTAHLFSMDSSRKHTLCFSAVLQNAYFWFLLICTLKLCRLSECINSCKLPFSLNSASAFVPAKCFSKMLFLLYPSDNHTDIEKQKWTWKWFGMEKERDVYLCHIDCCQWEKKKSLHDSKTALELYPDGTTELCRTHMEASLSWRHLFFK